MKEELSQRFGAHRVKEVPTNENEVPLILLDLELNSPVMVLMTNGLSNYKMPVPSKLNDRAFNEIYFCLPSYWEWEDIDNPNMNWVFHWIQRLAKYVVEKETWFGHGHTIPCGSVPESLSDSMRQNHFFLSDPILLNGELAPIQVGEKQVNFLSIIPIFKDELDYKQSRGTLKFTRKLINKGVSEKLDDFRSSVLKNKWRLKRK